MRTHKLLFLSTFLVLTALVSAQKPAAADALEANLRKHVEYLASGKLEGRKTGEPGAAAAAQYVAKQFAQFKLKPGVKVGRAKPGFMQPFPYVAGVGVGENSYLRLIPAVTTRESKFEPGITYMPFGNSINGEVANAPLVFAGYGIATPDQKYDDYAGLDVGGKIVLAFDGTPDATNPHSEFGALNIHAKANIAKERGARALVLIARSEDFAADPLARLRYEPTMGETAIPVLIVDRSIAAEILGVKDIKELAEIEKSLATPNGASPAPAETRPLGSVPAYLTATAQLKVELIKKTVDAHNVIGIVEGNDPVLKNEAIVIGAHYDHLGRGGRSSLSPNSSDIHHGADDNASGTAAVIELAGQFAKEKNNKRTLIFMAFGGEEEGLLGSKHYVNNPIWPLEKTIAMINLDMVGRLNEQGKLTIGGIGTANEWNKLVKDANQMEVRTEKIEMTMGKPDKSSTIATRTDPIFDLQLNEDGYGPSDHSSFYGKQIPVLFMFTGTHLDYHKPTDTSDKINYEGLTMLTYYVGGIIKAIDKNPSRPIYKIAQSSSGATPRVTFSISLGSIPSYAETNDGLGLDGVRDGSPAGKAGLKAGDKIVKLAGKDVRNISDYMFAMSTMKAGEEYEVIVKRGAETLTMKIVPAAAARR